MNAWLCPWDIKIPLAYYKEGCMDGILSKYQEFCMVYIDDILIFSEDKEQHMHHLKIVAKELAEKQCMA
jgi:hypothetical protein